MELLHFAPAAMAQSLIHAGKLRALERVCGCTTSAAHVMSFLTITTTGTDWVSFLAHFCGNRPGWRVGTCLEWPESRLVSRTLIPQDESDDEADEAEQGPVMVRTVLLIMYNEFGGEVYDAHAHVRIGNKTQHASGTGELDIVVEDALNWMRATVSRVRFGGFYVVEVLATEAQWYSFFRLYIFGTYVPRRLRQTTLAEVM